MTKFLILAAALIGLTAWADDLTVKDGTVYRNVVIISADPDQMLIVHDGGGCQVKYNQLAPHSLSAAQRAEIENQLKRFVEKQEKLAKAEAERKAFENEQREKGRVEFEGGWMTPLEKEEILMVREERKLELERRRLQLAKERAKLDKEQLETARARYLLEGDKNPSGTITVGYFSSYHRSRGTWYPYSHGRNCADKNGCNPSLYTRNNFTGPPKSQNGRIFIDAGKPLTYHSGVFSR